MKVTSTARNTADIQLYIMGSLFNDSDSAVIARYITNVILDKSDFTYHSGSSSTVRCFECGLLSISDSYFYLSAANPLSIESSQFVVQSSVFILKSSIIVDR